MKIRDVVLCVLSLWCGAFAASNKVAEYCTVIVDDSTYRTQLVKDLNIPITKWEYPDSIPCTHTPCGARWKFENDVQFPYDIHCRDDGLMGLWGGGEGGIATCVDCAHHPIKIPRIDKISLYGASPSRGESGCCGRPENTFYMRNARESLKPLYGLVYSGKWTATLNTDGNGNFPPIVHRYGAKLTGECSDTIPSLDYCVNPKDGSLHLEARYEVLPNLRFGEGENLTCEGAMEVEKSFVLDFEKYGKKTLAHVSETDTCHGTTLVDTEIFMPIPEFVDGSFLKGVPLKNFYGKVISIDSKNKLICNHDSIEKGATFRVRITGACGKFDIRPKMDQNWMVFEQTRELRFHGEDISQWVRCGENHVCLYECIEVKDLLK